MNSMDRYKDAVQLYAKWDIDVDEVLQQLAKITISLQCWQGDDVAGFESRANALSGGIITTGSYPGKARNATELRLDLEQALSLIPGRHKVNLHAIYADGDDNRVERNHLEPKHFTNWVTWAKKMGIGLDFNPTLFSHRYAKDGLTLSHPDANIRQFWIEHCQASRRIGAYFGKELGEPALTNIWIPDGYKDLPSDRLSPRARLKASLDEIFKEEFDSSLIIDSLESKVFGIGMEAYTVGSHEFYLNYANQNHKICLLDNGHFHPTESVADKISSMLLYFDKIALHLTRPMRWDSDHVVLFDEEIKEIAKELVRTKALDRVMIGLDFFDASINRVAAWVIGARSVLKSLLYAMLMPHDYLKSLQDKGDFTTLLALTEELKSYPMGDLWDYYCLQHNVPIRESWLEEIHRYESDVLSQRK